MAKKRVSKLSIELYPKQMEAFHCPAQEQLFGGASEGGKSYYGKVKCALLAAAVPNLQVHIFRKHYKDVLSLMEGATGFPEMLRPWVRDKFVKITENEVQYAHGSLIQLNGLAHKKDLEKNQGKEKQILWFDEATQIPAEFIKSLRAWVRMPKEMQEKLPEQLEALYPHLTIEQRRKVLPFILYTANPIGMSVGYFKRGFVMPANPGAIHMAPDSDGGFSRVYIPSRIGDNPSADPEAQRKRLSAFSAGVAQALIEGSWDAPQGDFFPEYNDDLHSVEDFEVPKHWFKFRTFDWGSSDPFAVLWFAVSDGAAFIDGEGRSRWFPRGALVVYREWYGCNEDEPSKGINMRNEDIARGIVERTREETSGLTYSDNFPFADRGQSKNGRKWVMADDFKDNGCPLILGNTARVYGWKQIRSRLQGENGVPLVYIQKQCVYLRQYLPQLGYNDKNTEDAQTDGEATHICDGFRLGHTIRPVVRDDDKPREMVIRKREQRLTPKDILLKLSTPSSKSPYVTRK